MGKLIDSRLAGLVFAVVGAMSTQACGEDGAPGLPGTEELLQECGLVCASEGIAEGNASISGIPNIDAFFSAVVNFNSKANLIAGNINGELAKIKASVGLEANAPAADIEAAIIAKFSLDAEAGVKIAYEPAKCAVSAKATLEATAKCDASVDPGKASVECKGSCEAEASVEASCDAEAEVKCVGTAPMLACEGTCKGGCELEAAASCEGTCKGTCSGTCSSGDSENCNGSCDGMCEGTCETTASVECSGKCKGECTYTPPDAKCEAGATVKCEAKAGASVQCQGKCEGEFEPPMAKAECQASAKAEASVAVECTPPSIGVSYQFEAGLTAAAQAEAQANLEAFLVSFKGSMSVIVAQLAQGELVVKAGADIGSKGVAAVQGAVEAIDVDASLKVGVGVTCALGELPKVAGAMKASTDDLKASVEAAGELTASLGG
jgi:hypothetical protein